MSNETLLVLGTASRAPFHAATEALAARLPHAAVLRIEGAAHAAHHSHVPELTLGVEAFLDLEALPDVAVSPDARPESDPRLPSGS